MNNIKRSVIQQAFLCATLLLCSKAYSAPTLVSSGENTSSVVEPTSTVVSNPSPEIYSFESDTTGPVHGGAIVHTILYGTPGATAVFCIPNVAENIPMTEQKKGVYYGIYNVPKTVNASRAAVVGHLSSSPNRDPVVMQATELLTIDNAPPEVLDESPAVGAEVSTSRPEIYALIDDGNGVGVNQSSIHLFVDGVDVTRSAVITDEFVTYQPARLLTPGKHSVAVQVADILGNVRLKSWDFSTRKQSIAVTSFSTDRPDGAILLKPHQKLTLTLIGESGGTAFASVGSLRVPLVEHKPGNYIGELVALPGSSVDDAPVTAHFTGADHTEYTANLSQELSIDAGLPPSPSIVTPSDGDAVGTSLQIKGLAQPGSTINVRIDYVTKAFGLFAVNGTAAQTQVIADGKGTWSTDLMSLLSPTIVAKIHDTVFTVLATSEDALGHTSTPTIVKVTEQD